MNAVYRTASISTSLFSDADAQFATMKETLTSADFQKKTAAEVQRWLAIKEKELMRQLCQSHITLKFRCPAAYDGFDCPGRAACEANANVKGDFGRVLPISLDKDRRIDLS